MEGNAALNNVFAPRGTPFAHPGFLSHAPSADHAFSMLTILLVGSAHIHHHGHHYHHHVGGAVVTALALALHFCRSCLSVLCSGELETSHL